jgi:alkanesulfonate monooxygenase SsuD/methylene tetrahydromethanopterin reductase-like flavin-dependent oxidoreductase (luciferase family)
MKFGDFLFPESSDPTRDGEIIDDALAEARLCDDLGMDAVWLAEHHFDGNCAYVDPVMLRPRWRSRPSGSNSASRLSRRRSIIPSDWPSNWLCSTISARGG